MNGIHDMGGMHGFGPIEIDPTEPLFHEPWEARVYGLSRAMTRPPEFNTDFGRYTREVMPPDLYLTSSYYARWLWGFEWGLIKFDAITPDELQQGHAALGTSQRTDARKPDDIRATINHKTPSDRVIEAPKRFAIGDKVITHNLNPAYHTRLPRYARGKQGTVLIHHGAHVLPDSHAHGQGENPEHLYTVAFKARELWGPSASPQDQVMVDCWESYLDAA